MRIGNRVSQQIYKPGTNVTQTITGTILSFGVNMVGGPEVLVLWDGDEAGMETGENPDDLMLV